MSDDDSDSSDTHWSVVGDDGMKIQKVRELLNGDGNESKRIERLSDQLTEVKYLR